MSYGARNPEGAHRGTMLNVRSRPNLPAPELMVLGFGVVSPAIDLGVLGCPAHVTPDILLLVS